MFKSILIVLSLLIFPLLASAIGSSEVYFRTTSESFIPGSEFVVGVFVTSDKPVNAYEFDIAYSLDVLEFVNFNRNNSIIEFWRNDPEIYQEGIIKLRGGSIKPFEGRAGEIIKLNFRAKKVGLAQWSFRRANMFYADGKGTAALVEPSFMTLEIKEGVRSRLPFVEFVDQTPPLISEARAIKNPLDGSNLAAFVARDAETGIKTTLFRWRKWFGWSDWEVTTNPVRRLEAGVWSFQFKSVDNSDNVSKKTVYIWEEFIKKALLSVLFVVLLVIGRTIYGKIIKKPQKNAGFYG